MYVPRAAFEKWDLEGGCSFGNGRMYVSMQILWVSWNAQCFHSFLMCRRNGRIKQAAALYEIWLFFLFLSTLITYQFNKHWKTAFLHHVTDKMGEKKNSLAYLIGWDAGVQSREIPFFRWRTKFYGTFIPILRTLIICKF